MLKSKAGNMGRNKIRTLKTPQPTGSSKDPLVFLNLQWSETSLLRPLYKIIMAIHINGTQSSFFAISTRTKFPI